MDRPRLLQVNAPLLSNEEIAPRWKVMRLRWAAPAARVRPGQFFMVRAVERAFPYLPRPFTLFDAEPEGRGSSILSILYLEVGEGTAVMGRMRPGESLRMLGPLGTAFTLPGPGESAVFIAGGIGVAPFHHLAREMTRAAAGPWTLLLGGRTSADVAAAERFREMGGTVRVATEDGSLGRRGLVTALLDEEIDPAARLYACGPHGMLRAVAEWVARQGRACQVSVEDRMACGYGVCVGCAVPVRDEGAPEWRYARACVEGPVFEAARLVWDTGEGP